MNKVPKIVFYMFLGFILYPMVLSSAMLLQITMWLGAPVLKLFDKCILEVDKGWKEIMEEKDE